jgi:hypothetical protein
MIPGILEKEPRVIPGDNSCNVHQLLILKKPQHFDRSSDLLGFDFLGQQTRYHSLGWIAMSPISLDDLVQISPKDIGCDEKGVPSHIGGPVELPLSHHRSRVSWQSILMRQGRPHGIGILPEQRQCELGAQTWI